MPLLTIIALLASGVGLGVFAVPGEAVEMSGARHGALIEAARAPETRASVHAASRTVEITRAKDGRVTLRARWQLGAGRPGWLAGELVGGDVLVRSVTVGGKAAATAADREAIYVATWVTGPTTLELVADLRGDPSRGPVPLRLLAATRGTAVVRGEPTWRVDGTDVANDFERASATVHIGGVTHGGASALQLGVVAPTSTEGDLLAIGRVGVGLFVGDAEIRGRARLQWLLRRGELARVAFVARGVGDDFAVTGPDVREVVREGELVRVELQSSVSSVVALEATWSNKTPPGDAVVVPPSFQLEGTGRTEASFELGRDGDVDIVPVLDGWRQVAAQQLPPWGRDLIEGTSAAAWTSHASTTDGRSKLQLLRFVPVEAPKVVIGEATFELASAHHGMTLVKARYEVLNERASHLRVTLPPGSRLLAVEVAGADARTAKDGDQLLVPITRSLETLQGLVAIPVVISVLVEDRKWKRREHRELVLPTIDAPIRKVAARWLLPRDIKATSDVGEDGVDAIVPAAQPRRARGPQKKTRATGKATQALYDFDEDTTDVAMMPAGSAVVDDDMKQAESDRLLREAQESYNRNEFDDAQQRLDDLRTRGLDDEEAAKLQSNLDVLNAPILAAPEGDADPAPRPASTSMDGKAGVLRRIKDQARARGAKKRIEQDFRKRKAKELRSKGDYAAAEAEYRSVIEENRRQGNLEQEESAAADFEAEELEKELESTKTEAAARASMDAQTSTKLVPDIFDEPGEHGFGAAWHRTSTALDVPDPPSSTTAAPNYGPRVLMPGTGGDLVVYAFDLWAPGARKSLVVDARRRRHR
jgi:hypothetical protein